MKPIVLVIGLLGLVLNILGAPVAQMEMVPMMRDVMEPVIQHEMQPIDLVREGHSIESVETMEVQAEERMGKGKGGGGPPPPPPPPPPPQQHVTIIYPAYPIRPQYGYPQIYAGQSYGSQAPLFGGSQGGSPFMG